VVYYTCFRPDGACVAYDEMGSFLSETVWAQLHCVAVTWLYQPN